MRAMTPDSDPNSLVELLKSLWALLLIPLGLLWRKVDNSASKEELTNAIKDNRDTVRQLFANAEADRAESSRRFSVYQEKLHDLKIEVLERLPKR